MDYRLLHISSSEPQNKRGWSPMLLWTRCRPFRCGRLGAGAQAVWFLFSSVEVRRTQVNTGSWPEQNRVSQSAVAETVVCLSRPHLNQSLIVNVWYCLGLSSLPFVPVRAFCLSSTSILARLSRFLCRSQPHGATGEHTLPSCTKLARLRCCADVGVGGSWRGC